MPYELTSFDAFQDALSIGTHFLHISCIAAQRATRNFESGQRQANETEITLWIHPNVD